MPTSSSDELFELSPTLRCCDVVGRLMEFWGFSRHMGRVWTLLYLSQDPLPSTDIQTQLQISAAAVSTVLKELRRWGVVKKVWKPGERKDYYGAETDLWKMVSRVFEERERNLITEARESFEAVSSELDAKARKGKAAERDLAAFRKERVEQLLLLSKTAELMLENLMKHSRLDLSPLKRDLGE